MECLETLLKNGGFWIHESYGAPFTHGERFRPRAFGPEEGRWIDLKELEEEYGKIIAIEDRCKTCDDECFPVIWTDRCVITINEYDGYEYIEVLKRNPTPKAEKVSEVGKEEKYVEPSASQVPVCPVCGKPMKRIIGNLYQCPEHPTQTESL